MLPKSVLLRRPNDIDMSVEENSDKESAGHLRPPKRWDMRPELGEKPHRFRDHEEA